MNKRLHWMASDLAVAHDDAVRDLARATATQLAEGTVSGSTAVDVASWLCAAAYVLTSKRNLCGRRLRGRQQGDCVCLAVA